MKQVTMRDVATLAGVSTTTVSHVINNTRKVEELTRQNVLHAMDELGYLPNSIARSLRSGETRTIGLIVPDVANLFFAEIARRIETIGFRQGYSVILCNSDNDTDKQKFYIQTLLEKQVDGVIFISAGESSDDLNRLVQSNIPIVVADRDVPLSLADVVMLNNEKAGYTATRHLIDLGHKSIACITGPNNLSPSMKRAEGYKRALTEAGLEFHPEFLLQADFQYTGGEEAMQHLLKRGHRPTAVFVLNDMMAIGAITAVRKSGLSVPEDISIVGFDDINLSAAITPSLTTVAQPITEMAEISTRLLVEKMQSDNIPGKNQKIILDAELVIRESTQKRKHKHE